MSAIFVAFKNLSGGRKSASQKPIAIFPDDPNNPLDRSLARKEKRYQVRPFLPLEKPQQLRQATGWQHSTKKNEACL